MKKNFGCVGLFILLALSGQVHAGMLGLYEVVDIVLPNEDGKTLCADNLSERDPDEYYSRHCEKKVRVVRSEDAVGMIEAELGRGGWVSSYLLQSRVSDNPCKASVRLAQASGLNLFSSYLCRAVHVPSLDTEDTEVFGFNSGLGAIDPIITLPMGFMTGATTWIYLPKTEEYPRQIIVKREVVGSIAYVPGSSEMLFTLQRVGD